MTTLERLRELHELAQTTRDQADGYSRDLHALVRQARAEGYKLREIADALGVQKARVSQMLNHEKGTP